MAIWNVISRFFKVF